MMIMVLLRCMAWLLVFSCLSTGVPVKSTNHTKTSSPGMTTASAVGVLHLNTTPTASAVGVLHLNTTPTASAVGVLHLNTTLMSNVSTTTLNNTQNATETTSVSPGLGASNNQSAETLEELEYGDAEEGDILPKTDRNAVKTVWSGAVIPYTISPELAPRKREIEEAFRMIMSVTCIRFTPHTNELNYIELQDGKGCASFVGCSGGAQPVYFGDTCSSGNLCHELLHAAGLHHEHTRHDRDGHVVVNWESIRPDRKTNFDKKDGNTLNLPYDLESIMHYGTSYFSVDGRQTLQPKQPGVEIGQRSHLSPLDARKLNALYRCGV